MKSGLFSCVSRGVLGALVVTMPWMGVQAAKPVAPAASQVAPAPVIKISGAWVRQAVAGQSGTGGFMQLISPRNVTLVGFSSPVAGVAELHEMKMDGDVMRMNAIESLPLPAGKPVSLQPGGHHLMLMSLKQPLKVGEKVPVTLKLRLEDGQAFEQKLLIPVRAMAPTGMPAASAPMPMHDHHHMDH